MFAIPGLGDQLESLQESDQFRAAGNRLFTKKKYIFALALYNRALLFCQNDPVRTALCHANRSAVYLDLHYFDHCMNNIQLAEQNYPREKIQKLHDRRDRCIELMKTLPDKSVKPYEHTFELSYDANPKIPFFIDAIELNSKNRLITTKDLKAGDVIAKFESAWRVPVSKLTSDLMMGCYTCSALNDGDLFAGGCEAMFCSDECLNGHKADLDHEPIHAIEKLMNLTEPSLMMSWRIFLKYHDLFGSTDEMRQFFEAHENKTFNFFDIDWSIDLNDPVYLKNMLQLMICDKSGGLKPGGIEVMKKMREVMMRHIICQKGMTRFEDIFVNDEPRNLNFIDKFMSHLASQDNVGISLVAVQKEHILSFHCHPAMKLMHRSCDPNIFTHFENRKCIVWTANQPISAGQELSSLPDAEVYYRKVARTCKQSENCVPCNKGWSEKIDQTKIDFDAEMSMTKFFNRHDPTKVESILKHIGQCCDYINSNFDDYEKKPQIRQKIASKKEELRKALNGIACPLPAYGLQVISKLPMVSEERDAYMNHFFIFK